MKPVEPIDTIELFPPLSRRLIAMLRTLWPGEWNRPTACAPWTVKDVAAHLLGGNFSRLWGHHEAEKPAADLIEDYDDLVEFINRENAQWVRAARRISPMMLVELLDLTDRRLYDHFKGLDPNHLARISVGWASSDLAPNWFDVAREYTEKWLHQQHIRQAAGWPLLTEREWLHPVFDTFVRGLPRAYRGLEALAGASVTLQITGRAGGEWTLVRVAEHPVGANGVAEHPVGANREESVWQLFAGDDPGAGCYIQIDQDTAWRLFTKGISPDEARSQATLTGDPALGEPALHMISIMA